MPDLKDAFDALRGDLLYGQSRDRGVALAYLKKNHDEGPFIAVAMEAGAWVTVDNYNAPLDSDYTATRAEDLWAEMKHKRDQTRQSLDTALVPKFDPSVATEVKEVNQEYQDKMKDFLKRLKNSRLSPLGSLTAPADKLDREGWTEIAKNRYYLAIRRACKFGIEHVAANTSDAIIHFVLNRFDQGTGWLDTLEKKKVTARGRTTMIITYSELRYVHKNWNRFSTRIQFYRYLTDPMDTDKASSFPSCPAPWEDETHTVDVPRDDLLGVPQQTVSLKKLWNEQYLKRKAKAYKEMVDELKVKNTGNYSARRRDIDNWYDLGNIIIDSGPDVSIDYYKQCVQALRGLSVH